MKAKRGKCLALVAVLAMVVCAFAIALPAGDSDASVKTVPIGGEVKELKDGNEDVVAGNYYVASAVNGFTIKTSESGDINVYLVGSSASLTVGNGQTNVKVYLAVQNGTSAPTQYYEGLELTAVAATYSVKGEGDAIHIDSTESVTTATYGVAYAKTEEAAKYYPEGAVETFELSANTQSVKILNGGKVTVNGVKTGETAAVNTIVFEDVTSSSGSEVTVTGGAEGALTLTGTPTAGSIGVTKGQVGASITATIDKVNYQFVSDGTKIYAAFPKVNADENTTFYTFGTIKGDLTATPDALTVNVVSGSYTGTINAVSAKDADARNAFSNCVTVQAQGAASTSIAVDSNGVIIVTGATDLLGNKYMTGSNVVLTGASATRAADNTQTKDIKLSGVALGTQNLGCELTLTGAAAVPADSVVTFEKNGQIKTSSSSGNLTVLGQLKYNEKDVALGTQITTEGTIYTNNKEMVGHYVSNGGETKIEAIGTDVTVSSAKDLLKAIAGGIDFTLEADISICDSVSINDVTIDLAGHRLVVGNDTTIAGKVGTRERGTLELNNVTIFANNSNGNGGVKEGQDSIIVMAQNSFNVKNSKIFAVVNIDEKASVSIDNRNVKYENTSSDVKVGFGTVLNLTGDINTNVEVYGELVIDSKVTIAYGNHMNVYNGASVVVNGEVSVAGTATLYDGSKLTVNGKVDIARNEGGAEMIVGKNPYPDEDEDETEAASEGADVVVASGGSLTVKGTGKNIASENKLTINNPAAEYADKKWTPRFLVQGTLTVNGTMAGAVHDMGSVVFNGKGSDTAEIVIYDGISFELTAVSGKLKISDSNIAAESERTGTRASSTGNSVVFEDAKGVVVTVDVKSVSYTKSEVSHTDYYTVMSVSGTVIPVGDKDAKVTLNALNKTDGVGKNGKTVAYISVSDDLSLGKNTALTFGSGAVEVSGTVNSMTPSSTTAKASSVTNAGATVTVTATGHIQALDGSFGNVGKINAVHYIVTVTGAEASTVDHYVGFNAAVAAADKADDKEIEVLGSVSASETVDIPAGVTVNMDSAASIYVPKDITVTLKDGAELNGPTATITVKGTFVSENFADDLTIGSVTADVIVVEDKKKTWTGLATAISMGMTDITLNGRLLITEDLEIPAGVKVSTNFAVDIDDADDYAVKIDGAKLTVNGTLYMGEKTEGRIILTDKDGTGMAVGGQFVAKLLSSTFEADNKKISDLDGAHFVITDGAYDVYYITSIGIAAETTSANDNVKDNKVTLKGVLAAGDVSFKGASSALEIQVIPGAEGVTILKLGTVTLENAVFTDLGTSKVTAGFTTAEAVFAMKDAYGFAVRSVTGENAETVIYGNISGEVELVSGTAGAGKYTSTDTVVYNLKVTSAGSFKVASGAELKIAKDRTFSVMNGEDVNAVIDGTITFAQGANFDVSGELLVNGTMNVSDFTIDASEKIRVTGTLAVADDKALTIAGYLILGAKPSALGASGTVTGTAKFGTTSGAILVYNGASMDAKLQINSATGESDAVSTDYVINGVKYATIYSAENVNKVELINSIDGKIELKGLQTLDKWYSKEDYKTGDSNVNTAVIGKYATVYSTFAPAEIKGTISKDAGIILTIDGLVVGSNGDVSQTLKGQMLSVGTHTIAWSERTGYNIENVKVTFNDVAVQNGGTITVDADMQSFVIIADGAVPGAAPSEPVEDEDDGMGITDILLIILVVLIAVMAIMVALRMMRS